MKFRFAKQLQEFESQSKKLDMISNDNNNSSSSNASNSPAMASKRNKFSDNHSLPSGMSSSASFERMQSIIKQQESEIVSLQEQLTRLENTKVSLEEQLVKLTSSNDK